MAKIRSLMMSPVSGSFSVKIYSMPATPVKKPVTAPPLCRCCPAAGMIW